MAIKITGDVLLKHDGKPYKKGDEIKKIKKEEAERLIKLGVAVDTEAAEKKDKKEVKSE